MVKYLLFKARKILKEGMDMERNYGEQSYNPKTLSLLYMGEGPNKFWSITEGKKIPQNILWACYNDSLSQEEISLQIGVALPYLEAELKTLEDAGLLIERGGRYSTNVIIFTEQFKTELPAKIEKIRESVADTLYNFIIANEAKIRAVGFHMSDMSRSSLLWHVTCAAMVLLFGKIWEAAPFSEYPVTAFGERAFVWGDEHPSNILGFCSICEFDGLEKGEELRFVDYMPSRKSDHHLFYPNIKLSKFFMKLAAGKVPNPNEYEQEYIAELIQKGYAVNDGGVISVTAPTYTQAQIHELYALLTPVVDELALAAEKIRRGAEEILKNHVPAHLKPQVPGIICMRMFDEVIAASVEIMRRKDYLKVSWNAREMPTVYAVTG